MRRLIAVMLVVASMSVSGCAFAIRLRNQYCSTGLQCATTILTEFKQGIDAHAGQDLDADDVGHADEVIDATLAGLAAAPGTPWRPRVATALSIIQANVKTPTEWVPYVTAALAILPLIPRTADEMAL